MEELSQGVRLPQILNRPRVLLVPCFWCSPRILWGLIDADTRFVLFGARPPEASLIPGDETPAALTLALEALSDPTRLTILRLLRREPLTQAEIARKLRLRASTISHHIKALRIAGLISYLETEGAELRYGARAAQLEEVCRSLKDFLKP